MCVNFLQRYGLKQEKVYNYYKLFLALSARDSLSESYP